MGIDHDVRITPNHRLTELAAILAAGIARLQSSGARANFAGLVADPQDFAAISPILSTEPLDWSHATALSVVNTVVNGPGSGFLGSEPPPPIAQELSVWL